MKYTPLSLLLLFTIYSCSKTNSESVNYPAPYQIDSISGNYLMDPNAYEYDFLVSNEPIRIHFTYRNGLFSTREGAFISLPYFTGYGSFYASYVYDTLIYSGNTITIFTRTRNKAYNPPPGPRVITLENGSIRTITTPSDTLYCYYNNKQLVRSEQFFRNKKTVRNYLFDGKGNLQEIDLTDYYRGDGTAMGTWSKETFGRYDSARNTLKGFGLWNDLFIRSLSENNFRADTTINSNQAWSEAWWTLYYDSKGNVDYSK